MSKPASAEIIAIGTELLLGEIVDTNSAAIARQLRNIGLDLFRTTVVGDNAERICDAVQSALGRAQVLIITGGLGPTVDDVTREGIARALGLELEFREELWEQIKDRFASFGVSATENNRRQAYLPAGSEALTNPVGTAPAFLHSDDENLLAALPGVPGEMLYLLERSVIPVIVDRFGLSGVIRSQLIRTVGVGESWLDEHIGDLETGINPTVGLAAHPGRVDIRITAKADSDEVAHAMIEELAREIRDRVGPHVYAEGSLSLEQAVLDTLRAAGSLLTVVESGTSAELARGLGQAGGVFRKAMLLPPDLPWDEVLTRAKAEIDMPEGEMLLVVKLDDDRGERNLKALIRHRGQNEHVARRFRGRAVNSEQWAASIVLDAARRLLRER